MHHINLVLAIVWLVVGVILAVWAVQKPETSQTMLIVVCGVLALYNLVRWFASGRHSTPPAESPRRRQRTDEPPDPTFDFSDDGK